MAYQILNPNPRFSGPVRGVLFDMDGVILDSEKLYTHFWAQACAAFGYPMTREQALGMRSLNAVAGQQYLSSLFGPDIRFQTIRAERIRQMDLYVAEHGIEAKPGIRELLDFLDDAGIPRAITTASPVDRIHAHLEPLGLLNRFDRVCTAYDVPHGKPEPDIYLYGAASLGLPPKCCLALEDSHTGILSAVAAGCRAVIVPDLDKPEERTLSLAFAQADSLTDVMALIASQNE